MFFYQAQFLEMILTLLSEIFQRNFCFATNHPKQIQLFALHQVLSPTLLAFVHFGGGRLAADARFVAKAVSTLKSEFSKTPFLLPRLALNRPYGSNVTYTWRRYGWVRSGVASGQIGRQSSIA